MDLARDKHVLVWLSSLAILILLMIIVGGLTRLTESGLSMVDWQPIKGIFPPLGHEAWIELFNQYKLFPEFKIKNQNINLNEFKFIFWWEYGHRILGRLIGLVFFIPFVFFLLNRYFSKKELLLYSLLFFLGLSQGIVGWWMVKSGLIDNPYVNHLRLAIHLFMAQAILSIISFIILKKLIPNSYRFVKKNSNLKIHFTIFSIVIIITILYGAFMAGLDAGKSFNTWPLMGDTFIPDSLFLENLYEDILYNSVFIHFTHRILAYLSCIYFFYLFFFAKNYAETKAQLIHLYLIMGFILIQILLGIFTVIYNVPVLFGSLHQLSGTILLVTVITFVFNLYWVKN